jgi:hypothetical protein
VEAAKVCLGGSTVPAAVVIVVKYRAYLSVGRLVNRRYIGMIVRSGCRRNGTVVIGVIPQAYQHGVLSFGSQAYRCDGCLVRRL